MTDQPDQPAPKRKRRRATTPPGHLDVVPASVGEGVQAEATTSAPSKRHAPRKRASKKVEAAAEAPGSALSEPIVESPLPPSADEPAPQASDTPPVAVALPDERVEGHEASQRTDDADEGLEQNAADDPPAATNDRQQSHSEDPPPDPPAESHHQHLWVYVAMGVFVLALAFGVWGVWTTWFAHSDEDAQDIASLQARNERLSQEVSTSKRSDQISREANRDLQRTLAERDEEIAGLRADVAFYERFVGATGQRRGLSVHDLEMRLQSGEAWHFVATLTQNLNRGAINTGRLTLSVEGTRNDRLERLPWAKLRKENNAPGSPYSFKYFQQVEGDVILPKDFKPVRVVVRLVPAGGSAVEQSFTWAETLGRTATP